MSVIHTISPDESAYTSILNCDPTPPKKLFYKGTIPTVRHKSVAIVGTRKPTTYGREITHRIAYELAKQGVVIISGLAYGVDSVAHKAALEAKGKTIAIMAHGLHKIYPAGHRQLAQEILEQDGALISEYDAGVEARPYTFLQRNRIVSGLADAIIITEAAQRSGTLNTAGHALTQGKNVYVVPGNITNPLSVGCNQLLLQGATPLLSSDQLITDIGINQKNQKQKTLPVGDTPLENTIIQYLQSGERDADTILVAAKADPAEFSTALTMLEINGVIHSLGGNKWSL